MDKILKVGFSLNSGDLLTLIPGFQHLYITAGIKAQIWHRIGLKREDHPVKDKNGESVCINEQMFEMLKPLLESQKYIESYNRWEGQKVDWDMDKTRTQSSIPHPYGDLYFYPFYHFPELQCDLSAKTFHVEQSDLLKDKILINRTQRYNNPYITYFFLKEYQDSVYFIGTSVEHKAFCDEFKLEIQLFNVNNFLELAEYMAGCRFFIGGQSLCFHIANGLKIPRLLEVCAEYPNTLPSGKNGYAFLYQEALELYFKQLINS